MIRPQTQIRAATLDELRMMVEWAAEEGWNPGLADAGPFFAADLDGFLIAELRGVPIGCISAVRFGLGFGFIGFYIIRPALRGQGFGLGLWKQAMARLQGRVIGLDGVLAQQANYARSGFARAWSNARYGTAAPVVPLAETAAVIAADMLPFDSIAALDATVFPAGRETFLRAAFNAPGAVALALPGREGLRGFGAVRPAREGWRIGPLTATDDEGARILFTALLRAVPEGPVFIDLPLENAAAVAMAEDAGMKPVFETARMYRGAAPAMVMERIYGLASFELG